MTSENQSINHDRIVNVKYFRSTMHLYILWKVLFQAGNIKKAFNVGNVLKCHISQF